ncbi:MAG TPA: hypothetical protein VEZ40_03245 [Pyrinomonadaceae bacterium]|nr:hypothetical protein [Pyrinomonadaceae bacterium]
MNGKKMWSLFALSLAALIFVGAQSAARAQATTVTSNASFPFADTAVSCDNETVNISGKMHLMAHVTTDARSGRHIVLQINTASVKGVGASSGSEYVSGATNHDSINDPDTTGGQTEYTTTTKFLLVGKGRLPDMFVKTTMHVTVNANGEVTAQVTKVTAECR